MCTGELDTIMSIKTSDKKTETVSVWLKVSQT